jgi:AraC-like DNA-binding protein
MIIFESDHTDFHSSLKDFAKELGTTLNQDTLNIPPQHGEGYLRAIRLPNGLSVCIIDCSTETDMEIHRSIEEPYYYTLGFEDVYIKRNYSHQIGDEKAIHFPPLYSGAYLNSTMLHNMLLVMRGCKLYAVKIIFDAKWMARYLGIEKDDKVIRRYIALKTRKLLMEPLDGAYKQLIKELIEADFSNPVYYAIVENRVMMMIEKFFTRLYERAGKLPNYRIDKGDIYRMMEVEAELTKDYSRPAPTTEALSEKFGVGISRLKRQFRLIYGYPIYEYFQKYRMELAKKMLLSGENSIKEIGYKLGYQNLSNFARAFKKAYHYLPSEVLNFRRKKEFAEIGD